jgi:hypothetical protein
VGIAKVRDCLGGPDVLRLHPWQGDLAGRSVTNDRAIALSRSPRSHWWTTWCPCDVAMPGEVYTRLANALPG